MKATCPACQRPLKPGAGHCYHCLSRTVFSLEEPAPEAEGILLAGDYSLREKLGEGGMGIVYRAWQPGLKRFVAVKLLRGGILSTISARQRFLQEAEIIATLQHPNIVGIHEAGEEDGVCWLAMDLVEGKTLEQLTSKQTSLPAGAAARYLHQITLAVAYAHEQKVLHRDLKPSNVMIDGLDAPRIFDFGIAKRLETSAERDWSTHTGQIVGTLGYLAPEQAMGKAVGIPADIYGLGGILYHLLTGRAPFQGPSWESVLAQIGQGQVLAPTRLNPTVPRALETICLKCLAPDPVKRYATAQLLADDLHRFLNDAPILAKPVAFPVKMWWWCRRHPAAASLIAGCLTLLALVVGGALWFAQWKGQNEQRSVLLGLSKQERESQTAGFSSRGLALLEQAAAVRPGEDLEYERLQLLGLTDILHERNITFTPPPLREISADGRREALWQEGVVKVLDRSTQAVLQTFPHPGKAPLLQLDDRGERLALAPRKAPTEPTRLTLFSIATGKPTQVLPHECGLSCLAWSGDLLAVGGTQDLLVHIWDTRTGQRLHRLSGHDAYLESVSFRPDGQELVSLARDNTLRLWHAGLGTALLQLPRLPDHQGPAFWDETGTTLTTATKDSAWSRFHFQWSPIFKVLAPNSSEIRSENIPGCLTVHPNGKLATTVDETCVRLWSLELGRVLASFPKQGNEWASARLHQVGDLSQLWLAGWNTALRRVQLDQVDAAWPTLGSTEKSPLPYGQLVAAASPKSNQICLKGLGRLTLANWPSWETRKLPVTSKFCVVLAPEQSHAIVGSYETFGAEVWDTAAPKEPPHKIPFPECVLGAAYVDRGRTLWLWGSKHWGRYDAAAFTLHEPLHPLAATAFCPSPDGTLAALLKQNEIHLYRAQDNQLQQRIPLPMHLGKIRNATLQFTADQSALLLHGTNGVLVRISRGGVPTLW